MSMTRSYGQVNRLICSHSRCSEPGDEKNDAEAVVAASDDVHDDHKDCDEFGHTLGFRVDDQHVRDVLLLDHNLEEELRKTVGRDDHDVHEVQHFSQE